MKKRLTEMKKLVSDLQALEHCAHRLGLHKTAQKINQSLQAIGYEMAATLEAQP